MPKIRVIDFETQGLEPTHKVCERGWCDVEYFDGAWRIGEHGSTLHRVDDMPVQARAVHHISAAETQPFPPFDAADMWVEAKAQSVDVIASHNNAFDGQYWGNPTTPVICTLKAARHAWPLEPPSHGNGVLRYWLEDQGLIRPDPALTMPPHRAGPDAYVTAHILIALLKVTTGKQLVAWTKQPLRFDRWGFGKHAGELLSDTPADYLDWVIGKSTLDDDVKWNCRRELDKRRAA